MPVLFWETRGEDLRGAAAVAYRVLSHRRAFGDGGGNLLVHSDNLAALKSLLPHYAGKVKCVFIDPPYNTGNIFDDYDDNWEHSLWLQMMYPRLVLLRDMLAADGSIWITIDDDEAHYLKVIMDEIFGRKNFVANVVWQKKHTRANDARWFSDNHDHILIYGKRKESWRINHLPREKKHDKIFSNPDDDPRGVWASGPCRAKTASAKYVYPIQTPSGRTVMPPSGSSWMFSRERFLQLIQENRIYFGKSGDGVPRYKRFLSDIKEGITPVTVWMHSEVGHNQDARQEVKAFNSEDVFTTPKPERLIERILHLSTKPGDLVLDAFLGSGTTAAVAHKMHRRWIGIESGEQATTHCIPRMQKVINGEQGGISESVNWTGGGGFAYATLGETVFDENGDINPKLKFADLAAHLWFAETRAPLPPQRKKQTPLLGTTREGVAVALLYNGVLKDKTPRGGNMLTADTLRTIRALLPRNFRGKIIVFGNGCRIPARRLARINVQFRQIPYDCRREKK